VVTGSKPKHFVDNLNNVRSEANRHFRNKKKAYLKTKIEELETKRKIKNIKRVYGGISDIKEGYQPGTNIVKDEKGDLDADSHNIWARWGNCFSHLLNVHGFNDVRDAELHTAETLVPEPCAFEVELAIAKLKSYRSPHIDQIPAELIKAGGRTIHSAFHEPIISIRNKEKFPAEWKKSIIVPIYKKDGKTDCSNYRGLSSCQKCTKYYPNFCSQV